MEREDLASALSDRGEVIQCDSRFFPHLINSIEDIGLSVYCGSQPLFSRPVLLLCFLPHGVISDGVSLCYFPHTFHEERQNSTSFLIERTYSESFLEGRNDEFIRRTPEPRVFGSKASYELV